MSIEFINAVENGPVAAGPYSLGVVAEGKFVFVSGQIPYDAEKKAIVRGTITEQTELVLGNMEKIVKAAGGSLKDVVSCRVFLQTFDREVFNEMNAVYMKYFGDHKPARSTVGVGLLGFDVKIECIAKIA
ncbi:MAG: Rid family detoxifying hydrolase [Chthoniobacterales bacterium]